MKMIPYFIPMPVNTGPGAPGAGKYLLAFFCIANAIWLLCLIITTIYFIYQKTKIKDKDYYLYEYGNWLEFQFTSDNLSFYNWIMIGAWALVGLLFLIKIVGDKFFT